MGIVRASALFLSFCCMTGCSALPPESSLNGNGAGRQLPADAYSNPADPGRQLTLSSEVNTIDLTASGALETVSDALKHNPPDHIIMGCLPETGICKKVASIINNKKISVKWGAPEDSVTLVYEHVVVEGCDNSYIENTQNQANLNHPALGCSTRMNTVQMVSDKKQFVSPAAVGERDGEKAAQNYSSYLKPPPADAAASTGSGTSTSLIGGGSSH